MCRALTFLLFITYNLLEIRYLGVFRVTDYEDKIKIQLHSHINLFFCISLCRFEFLDLDPDFINSDPKNRKVPSLKKIFLKGSWKTDFF